MGAHCRHLANTITVPFGVSCLRYQTIPECEACRCSGEIEGIVLGIEIALQCFAEKHVERHGGCVYIFCDCQKAIDVMTQHHELIKHPGVFVKVKHLGEG